MDVDTQSNDSQHDGVYIDMAVELFRVLSDATRVRLLLALDQKERSVNELAEILDRPAPAVSQHLAKLRWARMVRVRQEGNRSYYRLAEEHPLLLVKEAILQAEHAIDEAPAHHRTGRS